MRKALVVFSKHHQPLEWREVDIDRELDLVRQYDQRVPVLCYHNREVCHFFFDESALVAALALA